MKVSLVGLKIPLGRLFFVGLDFGPLGVIADVADEAETANTTV